jgi:hypothetical protein
MAKVIAGAIVLPGECGEDDITAANLVQMADTLETRPLTDADRRELVLILRWMAELVREIDAGRDRPARPTESSESTDV